MTFIASVRHRAIFVAPSQERSELIGQYGVHLVVGLVVHLYMWTVTAGPKMSISRGGGGERIGSQLPKSASKPRSKPKISISKGGGGERERGGGVGEHQLLVPTSCENLG